MQAEIFKIDEKRVIGIPVEMSFVDNKTVMAFKSFMPRRSEVSNRSNPDILDLKIYPATYFNSFNPTTSFTKYACVEVEDIDAIPEGMESFVIPEGEYAMFINHGLGDNSELFQYIFTEWIPSSEYMLDDRPHFDVLGEDYQNGDEDAITEIWVPVKFR